MLKFSLESVLSSSALFCTRPSLPHEARGSLTWHPSYVAVCYLSVNVSSNVAGGGIGRGPNILLCGFQGMCMAWSGL